MLKNYITENLLKYFKHVPTKGQKRLFENLGGFINDKNVDGIFVLKGYAGTGKTSTVQALVKSMEKHKRRVILLAPTGRAAKVLSMYSQRTAYTIHKKIYRQKSSTDGFGKFVLDKNLHVNTLFVVDEASMISNKAQESNVFGSGYLLDDLIEYVYNGQNCKLILIGDVAQLPPVGLDISPALDEKFLKRYSDNIFRETLTEVVRQEEQSGVLYNATEIRKIISNENDSFDYPKFAVRNYDDIQPISGRTLIEQINGSYDKYGINQSIVVCRSNRRANKYNQGIRNSILFREEELSTGDMLMVVKNNYFWLPEDEVTDFIANGDIVEVVRIVNFEERYDFRFANVVLKLIDYGNYEIEAKIIIDTLTIEGPALSYEDNQKLFFAISEEFAEIKSKRKRYKKIRENEYFNALQVKFAYAVTCHKAQGGQWKSVFIDQGYMPDDKPDKEYMRWLYTAFTRATEKIFPVNFKRDFYHDDDYEQIE